MAKRKNERINTFVSKKYNHETDSVPMHPTGFSLSRNDKDNLKILEFFFASNKNEKNQHIDLGSFVLSNRMAEELANMLKKNLNEEKNKEIVE